MSIVIVDYDVGNLRSVQKALEKVGVDAVISRDPERISSADAVVLPGVGAFAECMGNLRRYGLVDVVRDAANGDRPFLGICVGYQMLFESSEEFGDCRGFGVFKGKCVIFPKSQQDHHKIPHMGWNQVRFTRPDPLFAGAEDGADFYFVHSYFPKPEEDIVLGTTEYEVEFASCASKGKVYGVQFHPEKSQAVGLKVLENFAAMARG
ncbi:MAG: imidazole glycerol phosphate synthase subunit HisH [Nitrospinota bacterium]|nr:imidazole glycerol phosphate synthase subunit HisH [Nitrospinota bacterium]